MELKKNPNVDVARQSTLFLCIGMVISLFFTWRVIEYTSVEESENKDKVEKTSNYEEQQEVPPTEQTQPPAPVLQQPEIIEIPDDEVEDEIEINNDVEMEETTVEQVQIKKEVVVQQIEEETTEEVFTVVENQPEFQGGMSEFYKYLQKKLKYPTQARRMGVEGKVFVQFVVDKTGALSEIKVIKGIGSGCDEEAIRVLQESPIWSPGKQRGKAVKVKMVIPIVFKLG
jgi:protein TonB